jgi:dTDP-4-dehydrorhamnose 3,5-epimerase
LKVFETTLPGVIVIEPKVFGDERGFFMETFQDRRYRELGIKEDFVQDNASRSCKGVMRGLHYQIKHQQGKLVSVSRGIIFDVAVDIRKGSPNFGDIRKGSPNFGEHYSHILSEDNRRQMYIPPGFAHGVCVISDIADFTYKCTDYYDFESERGVAWDDPGLAIEWPLSDVIMSDKDKDNLRLSEMSDTDLPVFKA